MSTMVKREEERLRSRIVRSLRAQGFRMRAGLLVPPDPEDKSRLRDLHLEAVRTE